MLIDKACEVSTDQALSGTGLVGSTSAIDFRCLRDMGGGDPWFLYCRVTEAFASGTALTVYAASSPDTDMTNAQHMIHGSSQQMTVLQLTLNAEFYVPIGPATQNANAYAAAVAGILGTAAAWQYFGALFLREGTFTAGKLTVSAVQRPANFGYSASHPGMLVYPSNIRF